ncbi:hypothetical protein DFH08DRAFT_265187 [Mycena albidolilacea]|uniref:Uncharacterized protein n=1 Tax=Mycena albidolilacea TaxID=1033008 RepID=A0AAD7AP55_9AGAR|nr:hypothetical protein DFH08DRAFT_265187 [Mycena albidolilacea]
MNMMKFIPLLLVLVIGAAAQLTINTPFPGPAECASLLLSWEGGTRASLSPTVGELSQVTLLSPVLPCNVEDLALNPIISFPQQTGTQLTWTVNQAVVRDDTGQTSDSASFTVASGSDECIAGARIPERVHLPLVPARPLVTAH